ncbi:c-type cytochrome [Geitlerinema sp. PCC 9228]|jgi:cytochrome c6|uniref:cytochrome c6 PetJ n=1 Tax=Geitlerinema sp. PCC 9228 TaxID=111611 RepID=UPI000A040573
MLLFALGIAWLGADAALAAQSGDPEVGAKIFQGNCVACHVGGGNVVMADKTLRKSALKRYGMYSLDAIQTQVEYGKNAMPSFGGRLNEDEIRDVATYVFQKAQKGW